MEENDFWLNILIGIVSGLIVVLGQFVAEAIQDRGLRLGATIGAVFIFFMIFHKIISSKVKKK